jgi:hypothetical protein
VRVSPRDGGSSNLRGEGGRIGREDASEGFPPNTVRASSSALLGLNRAARSGSREPKLKLKLLSCSPWTTPPIFGGLSVTSSTTTPFTPFHHSFAVDTSFDIMASRTSAVSLDVDRSRVYASLSRSMHLLSGRSAEEAVRIT